MSEYRPDPDALLARVKEEEARAGARQAEDLLRRGRRRRQDLRDAGGRARAARRRRRRGRRLRRDPRPRRDRGAPRRLEILPRRPLEYRGTTLARVRPRRAPSRRRPALILVDELAHTNAPGSRHAKRWQDVVELLDAGIDVYTTVNVQHVESLNDVVAKITGVVVRETVPDSVFEQADEVELIDLPPDDLLQRLREGKVYVPDQAQEAARELLPQGQPDRAARAGPAARPPSASTRRCASTVREHAIERIVADAPSACWSASARARPRRGWCARPSAWPIGSAPSGSSPTSRRRPSSGCRPEARDGVIQTLRLAEQLGAETVTLSGATMSEEILAYARDRNVTKIVVGKPSGTLWQRDPAGLDRGRARAGQRRHRRLRHQRRARGRSRGGAARAGAALPTDWARLRCGPPSSVGLATAVAWAHVPVLRAVEPDHGLPARDRGRRHALRPRPVAARRRAQRGRLRLLLRAALLHLRGLRRPVPLHLRGDAGRRAS